MQSQKVTPITDGSGDATYYSTAFTGKLRAVQYTKVDYDAGVDFTITTETHAVGIWTETNVNASETVWPTQVVDDQVGADTTTRGPIYVLDERVKIVIAQGGATKSGTFRLFYD